MKSVSEQRTIVFREDLCLQGGLGRGDSPGVQHLQHFLGLLEYDS